jgi:prophage regulatory protein
MTTETDELLDLKEVLAIIKYGKSTLYKMVSEGEFPAPAKISGTNRWSSLEVQDWIRAKLANRDAA